MNKFFFPAVALVCASSLVSCDSKTDPPTEMFGEAVATLIVPADANQPSTAQKVSYAFKYDYGSNAMDFNINGVGFDGNNYKFVASGIPASLTQYYGGQRIKFTVPSMSNVTGGPLATDIDASVLTLVNFQPVSPDLVPAIMVKRQYNISYKVGDLFTARTFDDNAFYFGTTATTYVYNDQHKEFASEKPVYNVVLDLAQSTATVSVYNPVFAAEMPPSMTNTVMVLEGLKVEYTRNGYKISGENIIPKIKEGTVMTPMPAFTFNNFLFTVDGNDLRYASASFKVAGRYNAIATITSAFDRNTN